MAEFGPTYQELDAVWPWRQVLAFYERFLERRYVSALPQYEQLALQINLHRKPGSQAVTATSIMPLWLIPERLRDPNRGVARFSELVVEAFEHALSMGQVSNGLLAALDVRDMRASGAVF